MITIDFKDLNDMMTFAKQLAGLETAVQPEKETKEPEKIERKAGSVKMEAPDTDEKSGFEEESKTESAGKEEAVYTLVQVREKLAELQKAGKRSQVQALIKGYGVDKLTEIPEEKYAELMEMAGEI